MPTKNTLFFEIFNGEFVEIITDLQVIQSVQMSTDNEVTSMPPTPLIINGFLMDNDNTFLYLSKDGVQVNQAIPLDSVKHIEIIDIKKAINQVLDDIPDPDETGEYH